MIMVDGLIRYLLSLSSVASRVGPRVFANRAPEGATLPCLIVQTISTPTVKSMSGPSGLASPRVQLSCWGLTYTDAKGLADVVGAPSSQGGLDGFRGDMNGVTVQGCHQADERDGEEPPRNANDVARHYVQLDFIIWYTARSQT